MLNKIFSLSLIIIVISKLLLWWPTTYFINLIEAAALLVMLVVVGIKIYRNEIINFSFSKLLTTLLLITIAVISWMVSYPDFRTAQETARFNHTVDQVIKEAIEEQKTTGRILSIERVRRADPIAGDKLEQAATIIRTHSAKSAEEVIAEVNPKINLVENQWSCNNLACGYATLDYVWTVNLVQYYLGLVLSLASIKIAALEWNLLWPSLKEARKLFKKFRNRK